MANKDRGGGNDKSHKKEGVGARSTGKDAKGNRAAEQRQSTGNKPRGKKD